MLLEPLSHHKGARSLMREWEQGSMRTFCQLLIAGAICGLLWEFWNFWSITKWIYTITYVGLVKVFEMPIFGFLGFPPFAVECFVMISTVSLLRKGHIPKYLALRNDFSKTTQTLMAGLGIITKRFLISTRVQCRIQILRNPQAYYYLIFPGSIITGYCINSFQF